MSGRPGRFSWGTRPGDGTPASPVSDSERQSAPRHTPQPDVPSVTDPARPPVSVLDRGPSFRQAVLPCRESSRGRHHLLHDSGASRAVHRRRHVRTRTSFEADFKQGVRRSTDLLACRHTCRRLDDEGSVRQKGNLSKENIRRSDLDWTSHLDDFFQAQDRPSKRDGSLPSPSPLSRCALSPSCCRALSFC